MFSLSNLSLQPKKNSEIYISDFQNGTNFSMLTIHESSPSSDTGLVLNSFMVESMILNFR